MPATRPPSGEPHTVRLRSATMHFEQRPPMQVFYRPEQSVIVHSASPSAGKPALVVADWRERFGERITIADFEPVMREDFYRVHDRAYVDAVFALERPNGFGTRQPEVPESLRYTSGSMRAAALAAWRRGGITASPTAGFHHAHYRGGGAYCTFNGLVLAALAVLDAGARQLAIIDCDYHYGDGTHDILLRLGLYDRVRHWTLGAHNRGSERQVLARLEAGLAEYLPGSELLIYQAGADSHEDDPLGGVFTTAGYRERDRLVFTAAARAGVPVAWNLAGGYQEPLEKVLELHAITMEEGLAVGGACCRKHIP